MGCISNGLWVMPESRKQNWMPDHVRHDERYPIAYLAGAIQFRHHRHMERSDIKSSHREREGESLPALLAEGALSLGNRKYLKVSSLCGILHTYMYVV
jgi:hypothetical protein